MKNINDYIGKRYGNLVVTGLDPNYAGKTYNSNHWLFECDCGNIISRAPNRILSGHCKSCGCRKLKGNLVHGLSGDMFYHTWWSMMQRCYNPKHHNYIRYGGRGIRVCDDWHDVSSFISWAKSFHDSVSTELTLERIDVNGDYCPENCIWADAKSQANNRRSNTLYTFNGSTKTFTQWCEIYGISDDVVWERIHKLGWDAIEAFTTPVRSKSSKNNLITIQGECKNVSEWCRIYGISHSLVYLRVKQGMSFEAAITTPRRK